MTNQTLPVLPLRDIVVFPQMIVPLFVGREKSVAALEAAMQSGKLVFLLSQKNPQDEDPGADDLYDVGTLATVLQLLKLPDGTVKVLVEGQSRAALVALDGSAGHLVAEVAPRDDVVRDETEVSALLRSAQKQFEQYVKLNRKLASEIAGQIGAIEMWPCALKNCSPTWKAKWACCRWKRRSATASRNRWKRRSANII